MYIHIYLYIDVKPDKIYFSGLHLLAQAFAKLHALRRHAGLGGCIED